MKQSILISAFLVVSATKMIAQEPKAIEIKNVENKSISDNGPNSKTTTRQNHEFSIVAHEDLDVNLKFFLKEEDKVNVVVTDSKKNVVLTEEYHKKGNNKIAFTINEDEQYTVKLSGEKRSNLVVYTKEY